MTDGNGVDAHRWPSESGIWTFICDDTDTATPMQWGIVSDHSNATISPSGIGAPNISAGTVVDGVLTGQVWQWTVTRSSTTNWSQGLEIQANTPGASGTYDYTALNETLFSPLQTAAAAPNLPSRSNLLLPDQAITNWMTTPTPKYPTRIRLASSDYGFYSNAVDADDLLSATDFSWGQRPVQSVIPTGSRTLTITAIRTYALGGETWPAEFGDVTWSSPYVYVSVWNNPTGYAINSVRMNNYGSNYTSPTVTVSGGGGSGCTLTATVSDGTITGMTVTEAGSGYTTPPTITISDSTGSGAIAMPVAAIAPASQGLRRFQHERLVLRRGGVQQRPQPQERAVLRHDQRQLDLQGLVRRELGCVHQYQ